MKPPKKPSPNGHLAAARPRLPGLQNQFKTGVAQPKSSPSPHAANRPTAPPAYRPQPVPKVLQTKVPASARPPQARPPVAKPVAPPAYRPQPVPKVLQTKTSAGRQHAAKVVGSPPTPPPNRPQPPRQASPPRAVARRVVQRETKLPNGAVVYDRTDFEQEREKLKKHIDTLTQKGMEDKAATLRKHMAVNYPELNEGEVVFKSVMGEQQPSVAYALWASSENGPYYVFPTTYASPTNEINATLANGEYQFVITVEHPNEVLVGTGGHASLAKGGKVFYAGTVYFAAGQLLKWNNNTGHYKTTPEFAHQTSRALTDDLAGGLLPAGKFEEYRH